MPTKVDRADPRSRQRGRDEGRADRWALRRGWRPLTSNKRVQACGHPGLRSDGSVVLQMTDARGTSAEATTGANGIAAGFAGLFHCGNVHVCAVCSARISAERTSEIERVMTHFIERGGWVMLVTLTLRHHRDHPLSQTMTALGRAFSKVNEGGTWMAHQKMTDYAGYCRAVESTWGPDNGWHPHVHTLVFFRSKPSADAMRTLADGMFSRWQASLVKSGLPAPDYEHGLDVQHLPELERDQFATAKAWAGYVAKGLAGEQGLGVGKAAAGSNRSIRELLRDAVIPQRWEDPAGQQLTETVDLRARALLHEYETVMKGRKQLTWSRHIRAEAQLEEERKDEEIVQDDEIQGENVAVLPTESWRMVEPRATELLAVTEHGGAAAARAWLDVRGIPWLMPTRLTDQHRRGARPGTER